MTDFSKRRREFLKHIDGGGAGEFSFVESAKGESMKLKSASMADEVLRQSSQARPLGASVTESAPEPHTLPQLASSRNSEAEDEQHYDMLTKS